ASRCAAGGRGNRPSKRSPAGYCVLCVAAEPVVPVAPVVVLVWSAPTVTTTFEGHEVVTPLPHAACVPSSISVTASLGSLSDWATSLASVSWPDVYITTVALAWFVFAFSTLPLR